MKTCKTCGEEKPLTEFSKCGPKYYLSYCKPCHRARSRAQDKANPERKAERQRKWCEANPGRKTELQRKWSKANPERQAELSRAWCKANPDKTRALSVKRRAAKLQRTPPWADLKAIEAVYLKATQLQQETGTVHHVDHIIPLQGKLVSGLHVENNLQVLTATENMRKHNSFNPTQHQGI